MLEVGRSSFLEASFASNLVCRTFEPSNFASLEKSSLKMGTEFLAVSSAPSPALSTAYYRERQHRLCDEMEVLTEQLKQVNRSSSTRMRVLDQTRRENESLGAELLRLQQLQSQRATPTFKSSSSGSLLHPTQSSFGPQATVTCLTRLLLRSGRKIFSLIPVHSREAKKLLETRAVDHFTQT